MRRFMIYQVERDENARAIKESSRTTGPIALIHSFEFIDASSAIDAYTTSCSRDQRYRPDLDCYRHPHEVTGASDEVVAAMKNKLIGLLWKPNDNLEDFLFTIPINELDAAYDAEESNGD